MAQSTAIASGATAADSSDIVVAADVSALLSVTDPGSDIQLAVQIKLASAYQTIGYFGRGTPSGSTYRILGPGTFRVAKPVTPAAVTVYLDA
jgi:hypothetical protein